MHDFIKALYPDTKDGYILLWRKDSKSSEYYKTADNAIKVLSGKANKNDIYIGCGLRDKVYGIYERGKVNQISAIPGFWLDVDVYDDQAHKKGNLPKTMDEALKIIEDMPFEPTILLDSGHGLQAWWLLDKLWEFKSEDDRSIASKFSEAWNKMAQRKAMQYGYDVDMTHDLARVLRIPGTVNAKVADNPVVVKLIKNTGLKYTTIDLKEKCMDFMALNNINTTIKLTNTNFPVNFKINDKAEPPFDKYTKLYKSNAKFKKSSERNRKDLKDQSPSAYDCSMAYFMVEDNWNDQEIVDTLIAIRRQNNEELKENRTDYFARTIGKVRKQKEDDLSVNEFRKEQVIDEQKLSENFESKVAMINALNERLGLNVNRIIKYLSDQPSYRIELADNNAIDIADVNGLINQAAFRKNIAAVSDIYIPQRKSAVWDLIATLLLKVCEPQEIGSESTGNGFMSAKITEYLENKKVYSDIGEAHKYKKPFYDTVSSEKYIMFFGDDFRRWLNVNEGEKLSPSEMGKAFRKLGLNSKSHRISDSKKCEPWWIPQNHPLYIEEKTDDEINFLM